MKSIFLSILQKSSNPNPRMDLTIYSFIIDFSDYLTDGFWYFPELVTLIDLARHTWATEVSWNTKL